MKERRKKEMRSEEPENANLPPLLLHSLLPALKNYFTSQQQHFSILIPPLVSAMVKIPKNKAPPSAFLFIKAGMPLMMFCVGASYVVKSGIEGKQKESDTAKGVVSK